MFSNIGKAMAKRHQEEILQMQDVLKKASDQRNSDNERHMMAMSALQSEIDKLSSEKANLYSEKCHEVKKCDHLRDELASLKLTLSSIKEHNEKLVSDMSVLEDIVRQNDIYLNVMQEKLKKYDKMKVTMLSMSGKSLTEASLTFR